MNDDLRAARAFVWATVFSILLWTLILVAIFI